jgi:hypothetical protein
VRNLTLGKTDLRLGGSRDSDFVGTLAPPMNAYSVLAGILRLHPAAGALESKQSSPVDAKNGSG